MAKSVRNKKTTDREERIRQMLGQSTELLYESDLGRDSRDLIRLYAAEDKDAGTDVRLRVEIRHQSMSATVERHDGNAWHPLWSLGYEEFVSDNAAMTAKLLYAALLVLGHSPVEE